VSEASRKWEAWVSHDGTGAVLTQPDGRHIPIGFGVDGPDIELAWDMAERLNADHGGYRAGFDAGMAKADATIAELQATIKRLNRRAQEAEAALADAKRTLEEIGKNSVNGTPWVGGSLGRALLAWDNTRLREKLAEAERLAADRLALLERMGGRFDE
jgi:chaperonin cofactor prefoldin